MERRPASPLVAVTTALLLACPESSAQGADDCAAAQVVVGVGTFPFDNTSATTDGVPYEPCFANGTDQIDQDVWFEWTAPSSGTFTVETCFLTNVDTSIAVHEGGCGGPVLDCNDDSSCGLQSSVTFNAPQGERYILRIGNWPGAFGGTGSFSISETTITVLDTRTNPANGSVYHLLEESTWTAGEAMARQLGGHLVTVDDAAENAWIHLAWSDYQGFLHRLWLGLNDAGVEGTFQWVSGSASSYTNWNTGQPSASWPSEDFVYMRPDGTWNDLLPQPAGTAAPTIYPVVEVGHPLVESYCTGDGSGAACPCSNEALPGEGCANSTGSGAQLVAAGTPSASADDLTFSVVQLPAAQPTLLFVGENAVNGGVGVSFGDGLRCAGLHVVRLGVRIPDDTGVANWGPGLGASGGFSPGDVRYFQGWYRDPASSPCGFGFNLSQGVRLTFTP